MASAFADRSFLVVCRGRLSLETWLGSLAQDRTRRSQNPVESLIMPACRAWCDFAEVQGRPASAIRQSGSLGCRGSAWAQQRSRK